MGFSSRDQSAPDWVAHQTIIRALRKWSGSEGSGDPCFPVTVSSVSAGPGNLPEWKWQLVSHGALIARPKFVGIQPLLRDLATLSAVERLALALEFCLTLRHFCLFLGMPLLKLR